MSNPSIKTIQRQIEAITAVANLTGALLTYFYFQTIDPLPVGQAAMREMTFSQIVIFGGIMAALFFIVSPVVSKMISPDFKALSEWHRRLENGTPLLEVPLDIHRQVLNLVPRYTLANFIMWVLAASVFGLLMLPDNPLGLAWRAFAGIVGVGGVLTTAIYYFVTDLIWRRTMPVFFPDGKLSPVRAFRLSVLGRLLIVFLLIGLYPAGLLVSLSLQRARALVNAPNPGVILSNLIILEVFILGVSVVASVGMAVFVTRSIVGPLRRLQAAMARVEQNDFEAQVLVTTNDELGYLCEGFNAMTAGLRRGEMVRTLLNLYVTPEVAREVVRHGAQLGGSLVECTVLFSDIRDFTGLSESLPPAELVALLNRYMSAMVAVVVEHGGMVNKFGGDSLLAVFGTPLNPAEDHAARAVRTALGMRHALARFNQAQAQSGAPTLRFGIGIATGPVVAGNVGGRERLEYTVIGDTVNLASRLQSITKELESEVLLSAETYNAAIQSITLEAKSLPGVSVRGKREAVEVYAI